ncbi:hypothetical protein RUM44_006027 [Polyplax serrata]|uniref:Uncharacterized protein n=1 Tax=Polyplax serrata TaxID=468196 RepID=A0ABR1AZF4_POLSC
MRMVRMRKLQINQNRRAGESDNSTLKTEPGVKGLTFSMEDTTHSGLPIAAPDTDDNKYMNIEFLTWLFIETSFLRLVDAKAEETNDKATSL